MKKIRYLIITMILMLFSTASMASEITYWLSGTSDKARFNKSQFLTGAKTKNFSIPYNIDKEATINSATLWVRAVDDFKGRHCKGNKCLNRRIGGRDLADKLRLLKVEGQNIRLRKTEIKGYRWYQLLDVTTFLLNDTNNKLAVRIKARGNQDFWFKNAKLVINYDPVAAGGSPSPVPPIDPGAPAPVPLPSALWLFGSVLLGFAGFRRKTSFLA
jgi:hypothetical protein